jgi:oligoendopeptidase F
VYAQLVADAHRLTCADVAARYLRLRARLLGLADLRYEDLYTPIIPAYARTFTPDEADGVVVRAVRAARPRIRICARRGLAARCDRLVTAPGKRSGAYSGMVYGLHPFQLQNFTASTRRSRHSRHESGHSIAFRISPARAQRYATWRYPTFIAEVASTLNEHCWVHAMLAQAQSDDERLFLLGSELELLRTDSLPAGAVRRIRAADSRARVEKGEPLTGENLKELYSACFARTTATTRACARSTRCTRTNGRTSRTSITTSTYVPVRDERRRLDGAR